MAAPRHGGRRLWQWSFTEFCEMVLRAAWAALGVRRAVPANQPLDDRFFQELSTDPDSGREWRHCRVGGDPPPTATPLRRNSPSAPFRESTTH